MRSSIILNAILVSASIANPIQRRAYATDVTIVTVTEYVIAGNQPTPTPNPDNAAVQADPKNQKPKYTKPEPEPEPEPQPQPQPSYEQEPAPPVAKPKPSTPPTPSYGTDYKSLVLKHHNIHRANHSAPSLTWSDSMESYALTLANRCVFKHDVSIGDESYGQNIGYGIDRQNIGKMITNLMYNNEADLYIDLYGEDNPDMSRFSDWGHFTQIVWKSTKSVGCATVKCSNYLGWNTVCNYSPPGNFAGRYASNVARPAGAAMAVA
ncbi:hypothetical protein PAAG_03057 [Paracoccidioides lutzii Pb01]|uniref:SCP domain-containing protein n=1 Tax=Paracoccidioides lutzii (strain ATCC MYA-826 / Pb01) TaxID=502779 RepID=C1GYA3_PARBA|nr:hypothetical protein PAAG_03057 [Paracoccidioides lutzii Pb01]EEH41494.1 hypothetical protein PAAG_03057 [Paracoccidioides lutzii Pb01]